MELEVVARWHTMYTIKIWSEDVEAMEVEDGRDSLSRYDCPQVAMKSTMKICLGQRTSSFIQRFC